MNYSFGQPDEPWKPFANAGPLPDSMQSELANEARRLWDEAQERVGHYNKVLQVAREAEAAHAEAEAERTEAIASDALSAGDGSTVRDADNQAAEAARWSRAAAERIQPAQQLAQAALDQYQSFIDNNAYALVVELGEVANPQGVHDEMVKAEQKARAILAPIERKHDEITSVLASLIGNTQPFTTKAVPAGDYREVPFLTDGRLAKLREKHEPAPVQETQEDELAAV